MAIDVDAAPAASSSAPTRAVGGTRRASDRRFLLLIVVIGLLYLVTSTWSAPYNVDSYTNVLQARAFAADASPIVADSEHLLDEKYTGRVVWLVESPDGPTSQYPPGVALWGAMFYLLDTSVTDVTAIWTNDDFEPEEVELAVPAFGPAALAAVVSTTLAMVFLGLTLRSHMSEQAMLASVAAAAFGTGAWSVASDQLWQHSPGMMVISMGVYFASRDKFAASGLAFACAVLIRPHTALIAAAIGLVVSLRRRQVRPLLSMGLTSALGLAAVVGYNAVVWDGPSISGGYGSGFTDRVQNPSIATLFSRIWEALTHVDHGVLASSPFLLVAFVALVGRTWRAPDWALGAALGGAAYMLIQLQANRVSGGNNIFGYRYPLEPLMAAAPLLALATVDWLSSHRRRVFFGVVVAVSVLAHGYGAIFVTA